MMTYGIIEEDTSDYNVINSNVVRGATIQNYLIIGAHTVIGVGGDW
jgi:hypothetical protein